MGALPSASASPPTNSVCTGSSRPPPPGSVFTLALFEHNLPAEQWPTIAAQTERAHLPPDPRRLRTVDEQSA